MVATLASGVAVVENDALAYALRKQRKYDRRVKKLQARAASVQSKKIAPVPAESTVGTRTNEFGDQTRSALSRWTAAKNQRVAAQFGSYMGPEPGRAGRKDSRSGSVGDVGRWGGVGKSGGNKVLGGFCLPRSVHLLNSVGAHCNTHVLPLASDEMPRTRAANEVGLRVPAGWRGSLQATAAAVAAGEPVGDGSYVVVGRVNITIKTYTYT